MPRSERLSSAVPASAGPEGVPGGVAARGDASL
ncbi:hypothetical protein BJ960_000455 [Leucobacter aridicollis]|uniref:Uncharacterized protein n=1 Tax=Leucobacter aridicollis TaxID=283878 RepID=A0A852RG22_9MICO|nr:hypothetical protein [Leucobacter aridicollis]